MFPLSIGDFFFVVCLQHLQNLCSCVILETSEVRHMYQLKESYPRVCNSVSDPDTAPNPTLNRENINFFFTFFFRKKYISPKYDLFCYLWGIYLCQLT